MVVPSGDLGDLLVTDRADPILFFPQIEQFAPSPQGLLHLDP